MSADVQAALHPRLSSGSTPIVPRAPAADRVSTFFDVTQQETPQHSSTPLNFLFLGKQNSHLGVDELSRSSSTKQSRKPSAGLAERLKALASGSHNRRQKFNAAATPDSVGRISEDQIKYLDLLTRSNSSRSVVQRRGRAWSGASASSGKLAPQIIGDSEIGFTVGDSSAVIRQSDLINDLDLKGIIGDTRDCEVRTRRTEDFAMIAQDEYVDVDPQKYRLPDHINGNGTKATPDTRRAHIERASEREVDTPPPISKESPAPSVPSTPNDFSSEVQSYFNPFGAQRAGSIYTLARVSFANQLAQLTSLQLPDAGSLSTRVSAITTSQAATTALMNAAEQIRSWISKASDVLGGLDADDDVEWAAAGGREGLEEVDNAISRFQDLIKVYVSSIEELQNREDIANVPATQLTTVVKQVETILSEWEKIRWTLNGVKGQVEIAMEWEELWNVVLGDIGNEMDILSRLVFEMEERRHRSLVEEATGVDLGELETIVEETPPSKLRAQANRFSIGAGFPMSPNSPSTPTMAQDDSSLLGLFARMQPLRASLDFVPMRLSTFHARAETTFPTACDELEQRRAGLESSWARLEKDAESLRRELGEDRWVLVFRGAGRQAQKLYESVDRSIVKLKESIDTGGHLNNPSAMSKKIESYETKKLHYGPAIERVLAIIEKGVHDRLTVNGEIVRLHSDMQKKWQDMKAEMQEIDLTIEELQADRRNQQLRDSISSLISNDRSTIASSNETPGSSPASSVIMSSLEPSTPARNGKARPSMSNLPQPGSRRNVTDPAGVHSGQRKTPASRLSGYGFPNNSSPSPGARGGSATPTGNRIPRPALSSGDGKPRWNSTFKGKEDPLGFTFNKLQLTSPSPHAKNSAPPLTHANRSVSYNPKSSGIPLPNSSPTTASSSSTPKPKDMINTPPINNRRSSSMLGSFKDRIASPGPYSQITLASQSPSRPRTLASQASASNLSSRRTSMQPGDSGLGSPLRPSLATRPASSLATTNKRASLLPTLLPSRGRQSAVGSHVTGRESPQAVAGAASAMRRGMSDVSIESKGKDKAKWK